MQEKNFQPVSAVFSPPAEAKEDLALYIHWPLCESKCAYCGFNSYIRHKFENDDLTGSLSKDLAFEAAEAEQPYRLRSVFFGGGSPSLMHPEDVGRLIREALALFPPAEDIEITLEANPGSVEVGKLQDFKAAGVNRLSMGIQSFQDERLKFLGRSHSVREAYQALEIVLKLFERASFDLIYALPGQSVTEWQKELREALSFGTEHLSLYQLTIDPKTPFAHLFAQGKLELPDPDLAADFYRATEEIVTQGGLRAYEVSNYARPGAESRHNMAYWLYKDYMGIGPGAHARLRKKDNSLVAAKRLTSPAKWTALLSEGKKGYKEELILTPSETAQEMVMVGLRLQDGLNLTALQERTGVSFFEISNQIILEKALEIGYLTLQEDVLAVTFEGRLRLDLLIASLLI